MGTIRVRFIMVALVVSFFAVGMAAFLNYFKYKSTIGGIVKSRVLVIGRGIENSVQASLQLGMQFTELGTLTPLLQRERTADRMIRGLDVFDPAGLILYSTERNRVGQKVPETWIAAAERTKGNEWSAEASEDYAAGITLKNSFDLTVGHLVLRYSRDEVDRIAATAGREILTASVAAFLGIAVVAPLALIVVIRRFERDMDSLQVAAGHLEDREPGQQPSGNSAFDAAIAALRGSLREANKSLDEVRAKLDAAG